MHWNLTSSSGGSSNSVLHEVQYSEASNKSCPVIFALNLVFKRSPPPPKKKSLGPNIKVPPNAFQCVSHKRDWVSMCISKPWTRFWGTSPHMPNNMLALFYLRRTGILLEIPDSVDEITTERTKSHNLTQSIWYCGSQWPHTELIVAVVGSRWALHEHANPTCLSSRINPV